MQRALPLILLLILGVAVWWLWTTRPPQPESKPEAVATAVPATPAPQAKAESSGPPPGYRLAGLAVGDGASFVAIELPDGSSHLYRIDSDVPGLGRVASITHGGVEIEGEE